MAKKRKSKLQSRKIAPKPLPSVVAPGMRKPKFNPDAPRPKPLAEFKKDGEQLNVVGGSKHDAPKFAGAACIAAYDVQNSPERYAHFREVAGNIGNLRTLYHGTSAMNISQILVKGLKPGSRLCMFGSGIYLGDPGKALAYAQSGWQGISHRYLLQVKVALGKIKECLRAQKWNLDRLQTEGFQSVAGVAGKTESWGGTLQHSEYVVYSPDQVLVEKIYEYQAIGQKDSKDGLTGTCRVMKKIAGYIPSKGMKAFADVLSVKECGRRASVQVHTDQGLVWVCNECISRDRLKVGSKIKVRPVSGWSGLKEPVVVRINSVIE